MAAPNIVNVTTIRGNTALLNVTTTSSNIVANPAASGKVFKINTILITNVDGANTANITAEYWRASIAYNLAYTMDVPADSTLVLLSKDTSIYVEEGDYIRLKASVDNDLHALCSYEELS
jgi:hypothetical protein